MLLVVLVKKKNRTDVDLAIMDILACSWVERKNGKMMNKGRGILLCIFGPYGQEKEGISKSYPFFQGEGISQVVRSG